jgi:hypothetical protein
MALCEIIIDEWQRQDLAVGMQYNALCQRYKKLMSVERKQILKEEIEKQKIKINEVAKKANVLATKWRQKLSSHTYYAPVANKLNWLAIVTFDELVKNYERWEKERL